MNTIAKIVVLLLVIPILLWIIGFQANAFGMIILIVVGLAFWNWYGTTYRPRRLAQKEAERQRQHEAAQFRLAQEAEDKRNQAAQQLREKHDLTMTTEQSRLDDEAAAERLRSIVNEILDYLNMIGPDTDKAEVMRGIHGAINRLVESKAIKLHHFDNDMLRFDIDLIVRKAQEKDLGDDTLVPRLRRALRHDDSPAPMVGIPSPSPTKA